MDARNSNRHSLFLRLAVLVGAAALFLLNLGGHGVVSEELRWAEIAREMRASGEWFRPTINGEPYFDKPVASYWLIVAASHLTGEVTEAAARLPAALTGLLGVWLLMSLAGRWYGPRTGLLAGAILATSFGFAFYARRATADVETVTGVLAAVWLFDRFRERGPGTWLLVLWLLMGVTSQMKGLLGFALPVAVFGVFGIWNGLAERHSGESWVRAVVRGNRWFFNCWTILAVPLGVGVFLLPYAMAASGGGLGEGLSLLYRENLQRFFKPHNHTGPVYLYFGVILVLALPWSLFLPAALLAHRVTRPADRLAWAYFLAVFAFFTASASRRSYYLLPVLPPTAVLLAALWATPAEQLRPLAQRLRTGGYAVLAVGAVVAVALLALSPNWRPAPFDKLPATPALPFVIVGGAGCLAALGWGFVRERLRPAVVVGVAAAGVGYATVIAFPAADEFRTRRAFADSVRRLTACDELALYRARDIVFDLRSPAPLTDYQSPAELTTAFATGRSRWVIARRRYWTALNLPGHVATEEPTRPWDGPDQLGDKMLLIDLRHPRTLEPPR